MGFLVLPGDNYENLEERYDALYEHYTFLQISNQNLTKKLDQQAILLTSLEKDWSTLFSDNIEYVNPSITQLEMWLDQDDTDEKTPNPDYSATEQAIELSMKAKLQNWKLSIVTISGNFGESITELTYCYTETELGNIVYITPQTDRIWATLNNQEIVPNYSWNIDNYSDVYVEHIYKIY
jgi:hypothetical protein